MRYKVIVAYNGSHYFGWQRQKDEITLQSMIEEKLSTIFNRGINIYASGRTDRGVHARGQVFHFDAAPFPRTKLKYALNKMLPADIMIVSLTKVPDTFHARYDAKLKEYEYVIYLGAKDVFLNNEVLFYSFPLDLVKLEINATQFVGKYNFQNFTSKPEDEAGFVREIVHVRVIKRGKKVTIKFIGTGFMRGQIRFMVGALLAMNEGREVDDYIYKNLQGTERNIIPYKVSGSGLYLNKVWYK